jgi:hypothetical protein
MTPLQLAQAECANHEHTGACLGTHLGARSQITHCTPRPRCVLPEGGRCVYFEECIAPLRHMITDPRHASEILSAVREYQKATGQADEVRRECPDCGDSVMWRKRYCPACVEKRRKATFRRAYHNGRQNRHGHSTVRPETPSKTLGNTLAFSHVSRKPYQDSPCQQTGVLTVEAPRLELALAGGGDEP